MNPTKVRRLLDELCVREGFCLSLLAKSQLEQAPPDDADELARAVFTAEGLNPDSADRRLFRQVRNHIAEAMRRSTIEAESHRYSPGHPT